jgi:pimeloyl-ACP methyl ester carboxylesterase
LLQHLTGVLDDWDPELVDGLASERRVIALDNRGVGKSDGKTPSSIEEMADDAIAFIESLPLTKIDLVGFSLGGFVSQVVIQKRPDLVRRVILAGTGPAGGKGINKVGSVVQDAILWAGKEKKHPKNFLFFAHTKSSQEEGDAFIQRLDERKEDRDTAISDDAVQAQLTAIHGWGNEFPSDEQARAIKQPVLVVNGDNDIMIPTINSIDLFRSLPNAELSIYPNAGHGGIFQYRREFVDQSLRFLGT